MDGAAKLAAKLLPTHLRPFVGRATRATPCTPPRSVDTMVNTMAAPPRRRGQQATRRRRIR